MLCYELFASDRAENLLNEEELIIPVSDFLEMVIEY